MNRSEIYTSEIPRTFDHLAQWQYIVEGLGTAVSDTIGFIDISGTYSFSTNGLENLGTGVGSRSGITAPNANTTDVLLQGFAYNGVSGFALGLTQGTVYAFAEVDAVGNIAFQGGTPTTFGDIAADENVVAIQCLVPATASLTVGSAPSGSGTTNWYLICVTPTVADVTPAGDPNYVGPNAVLPYYNSANPAQPLAGPGGANPTPTQNTTERQASGTVSSTAASNNPVTGAYNTGTTAPTFSVPSGAIPMYLAAISHGDTGLVSTKIWAIGLGPSPSTGWAWSALNASLIFQAPFLRGTTEQHHLGVYGSAPKIDGGAEWAPQSKVFMDTLGNSLGTFNQVGAMLTGGFVSPQALSGHLADAMVVGQLGASPGPLATGDVYNAPAGYTASSNVSLTAQGSGGAWSSVGTLGSGTQASLTLFNGALIIQCFNFIVTLSSFLGGGYTFTFTANLPFPFVSNSGIGAAVSLFGNVSDAATPACGISLNLVPVIVSSQVTQVKGTMTLTGNTGGTDVLGFYILAIGQ